MIFNKKVFQWSLKKAKEAKNKNDQKGPILKSYYKYHMWGIQKSKIYQKIQIERGCKDLKNSTLILWWAHCVSDWFWIMTSDMVKLRMDKKTFDLVLIDRVEISPTCEFDGKITSNKWVACNSWALWLWIPHPVVHVYSFENLYSPFIWSKKV